jgi:hypothetical protein
MPTILLVSPPSQPWLAGDGPGPVLELIFETPAEKSY